MDRGTNMPHIPVPPKNSLLVVTQRLTRFALPHWIGDDEASQKLTQIRQLDVSGQVKRFFHTLREPDQRPPASRLNSSAILASHLRVTHATDLAIARGDLLAPILPGTLRSMFWQPCKIAGSHDIRGILPPHRQFRPPKYNEWTVIAQTGIPPARNGLKTPITLTLAVGRACIWAVTRR